MIKRLMIVIIGLFLVATPAFASINTANLDGYWHLEETGFNYEDATSNNVDFNTGVATSQDSNAIYGFSQDFGSSIGIGGDRYTGNTAGWQLDSSAYTFNAWVYPEFVSSGSNYGAVFSQNLLDIWFGVREDGAIRVHQGNGVLDYASGSVSNNQWQMMTLTWDGTTPKVYLDGTYLTPSSTSGTPSMSGGGTIQIGTYNNGQNNNWGGNLDEMGAWDATLDAGNITALYNNGVGRFYNATSGAFEEPAYDVTNINNYASRYYKMEDTSGNIVDETGNQNGVATGISYGETGIINNAIGFDGTSGDKVEVGGYPTNANGVWSSCTWVYVTGSKAWENVWRADQTGVYRNVALQRTGDASGTYSDTWRYVFSNGFDAVGGTVNYNQWDHICTSNDGSTAKLYQNGVQVASSSVSAQAVTWNYDLTLGIRPDTGGEKYTGNMDEIAMFNGYTLTQADINFLYASGSPGSNQQYIFSTAPANTNPTITAIADQQTNEDEPIPIVPNAFIIGDAEDPISALTLSYTSSDTSLINSTGSITFNVNTTTGVVDMLDITPNANAFGTSTIDVTVTDSGSLTNTTSFLLTVFSVNDAPTITPIADQTTTEGATLVINFNVTDVDNPYTDLTYSAVAGNTNLIDSAVFSNYDGTNQTLTLVAGDYGVTDINVTVQDLQPAQASTQFQYLVNCNTTANYYTPMNVSMQTNQGTTEPVTCLSQTFNYNVGSDILTYQWYDFGATMTDIELYVYDSTGGFRRLINQTTLSTDSGTQTFDYSAINPHYDLLVIAELTDGTRNFGGSTPSEARILESTVNQKGQLGSLFSDADGIIYGVLILLLFLTIGIASQSATLTLIFSVLGLFIASRFVLKIPSEFIWITGALVVILLYLIAKLRTD